MLQKDEAPACINQRVQMNEKTIIFSPLNMAVCSARQRNAVTVLSLLGAMRKFYLFEYNCVVPNITAGTAKQRNHFCYVLVGPSSSTGMRNSEYLAYQDV